MMLTSPFYPQYQSHLHTPSRPSPLSERSANAASSPFSFNFSMSLQNEKKTVVPKRAYKLNPVMQRAGATRDAQAKKRRDMFLTRVQKNRDDKKWEVRGEQIQRLDFVSEQKRWQAQKAREAAEEQDYTDEELFEEINRIHTPSSAQQPEDDMDEADYILAQEEYELQELIASMEGEQDTASQHYGSDDEDYDQIFMECVTSTDTQQQPTYTEAAFNDADAMDIS